MIIILLRWSTYLIKLSKVARKWRRFSSPSRSYMILKVIHAAIGWIWLANRPDWVRNRQCNSWVLSPGCRLLLGRLLLCSIVKIIAIAQQMESILSWQKTFDARKVLNVIFRPRKLDLLFQLLTHLRAGIINRYYTKRYIFSENLLCYGHWKWACLLGKRWQLRRQFQRKRALKRNDKSFLVLLQASYSLNRSDTWPKQWDRF